MQNGNAARWCHLRWYTYHRRKMFKIAATARFCERVLLDAGAPSGWLLDAVAVGEDDIQMLVQVPAGIAKEDIALQLKRAATGALVRARVVHPWRRSVWDDRHWCAVLTNAFGVTAVRRHIQARSRLVAPARFSLVAERPGSPGALQ